MVTIAEAKIFAKLFPTNIEARRASGLSSNFRARLAPLRFFAKFLNFTLFEAIIPVSDPDEKAEKISNSTNAEIKKDIEVMSKEIF
jgi:hypothetical protein